MEDSMEKYRIDDMTIRKNKSSFNPSRDFLERSIEDYLEKGGRITRVVISTQDPEIIEGMPKSNKYMDNQFIKLK